ncbi:hypothetical protein SAMN05660463_04497 [Pseudomonas sp. URIL14HWK12:I9]|nr:hypothetical protein F474_04497 [Pseudomonas sp. URIL14HWK12:I12]PVZ21078.1 hypothetical protein F470_04499 [Pseudomonas sp. URIL14HWK12:I10]PVZ29677.1 hypothetical protein F472_04508 [Pseudomonas sp. URIL14HWK12:I11]SNZ18904.1 hypothetical protein SAMN05660463_04497 [Pseudomonas sp. URIL14HWK12:I9]
MHDSQQLQFISSTPSRMLLVVEPRSSEFWIEKGAAVRVFIRDVPGKDPLDVEYLAGGIVVYAHNNDQVEVYQNGLRLTQHTRTRRMAAKLSR